MRIIAILSLLLLSSPVFGKLTKEDIRTIIKEEITASEKRMKEYIDLKIETVNARIDATNARIDALDKSLNTRIDNVEPRIDESRIDESDENLTDRIRDIWLLVLALIGRTRSCDCNPSTHHRLPRQRLIRRCKTKLTNSAKSSKRCSNEVPHT